MPGGVGVWEKGREQEDNLWHSPEVCIVGEGRLQLVICYSPRGYGQVQPRVCRGTERMERVHRQLTGVFCQVWPVVK